MQPVFELGSLLTDDDFVFGVATVIKTQREQGQSKVSILKGLCDFIALLGMNCDDFCTIMDKPSIKEVIDDETENIDAGFNFEDTDDAGFGFEDADDTGLDFEDADDTYLNDEYQDYNSKKYNFKVTSDYSGYNSGSSDIASLGSFGLFLKDIANIPLLTMEEERKYGEMARSSNKRVSKAGVDALVKHNLRLVVKLAKDRAKDRDMRKTVLQPNDLVSAGSQGLIIAAKKFDYRKGFKFSTYATWWINQKIRTCINNEARTIRVSVNNLTALSKVTKFRNAYIGKYGKEPSVAEIAEAVKMSVKSVTELLIKTQRVDSLNRLVDQDDDTSVLETIVDPDGMDPLIEAMKTDFSERIEEVLATLPTREYLALKAYFGFDCKRETIKGIAEQLKIKEEEAKRAVSSGMKKLRSKARKEELSTLLPYLDI